MFLQCKITKNDKALSKKCSIIFNMDLENFVIVKSKNIST